MRNFFEPTASPSWLRQVLSSIRAALGDIWPAPLRLKDYASADLPAAADFAQGLVYDLTNLKLVYSTGAAWVPLSTTAGTVTSVSIVAANGVSGSVANPGTTPAITLALGAITPASVAASGAVTGSNLSGANSGDQTITLTGDVTGSGTGSFAASIASDAVTYAKMQNVTSARVLGRTTAGSGDCQELAITGTGNVVFSAGPTLTGTVTAASAALSGTLGVKGGVPVSVFTLVNGDGSADVRGQFYNSSVYALALTQGAGHGNVYLGATGAASPDLIVSNNAGSQLAAFANNGAFSTTAGITINSGGLNVTGATILNTALGVAYGGTGDTGTAWTGYTPTVAAGAGAFTTVSATGRYKQIGKTIFVHVQVAITSVGTASGYFTVTAPVSSVNNGAQHYQPLSGSEDGMTGASARAIVQNNSTTIVVQKYDGTFLGGNGYVVNINGTYEAA